MAGDKLPLDPRIIEAITNKFLEVTSGDNFSVPVILTLIEAFTLPKILTLISLIHKLCFVLGISCLLDPNLETTLLRYCLLHKLLVLWEAKKRRRVEFAQLTRRLQVLTRQSEDIRRRRIELLKRRLLPKRSAPTPFDELSLSSTATFEDFGLSTDLLKGLYLEMKFHKPSKIQAYALPLILTPPHKDFTLMAPLRNGSGKTTSFFIAMLSRVDPNLKQTQAICIVPTRDVAIQNLKLLQKMSKYTGITSQLDIPLENYGIRPIFRPPVSAQIVIGTADAIKNLMSWKKLKVTNLKVLAFEEVDQMFAMDRCKEVMNPLELKNCGVSEDDYLSDSFEDASREIMKCIEPVKNQCQVFLSIAILDKRFLKFEAETVKKCHNNEMI